MEELHTDSIDKGYEANLYFIIYLNIYLINFNII
jgi:hypothetical protein